MLKTRPAFPPKFPQPPDVRYTSSTKAGPSLIVVGYYTASLDTALSEYKDAVGASGYMNLKTEHDPKDAEINFAGGGTTGQIALRDDCKEPNTTYVRLTIRPNGAPTTSKLPAWFTTFRSAANDLVRETLFKDQAGSERGYATLKTLFAADKTKLEPKAPDETDAITMWLTKIETSLKAHNLTAAHTYAVNITKELHDAADKLVGVQATGLVDQLTAAAHDLDQEAGFKDVPGTKRALAEFTRLFASSRKKIEAKSALAEEIVAGALAKVTAAVKTGDNVKIRTATKGLVAAVAHAAKLV